MSTLFSRLVPSTSEYYSTLPAHGSNPLLPRAGLSRLLYPFRDVPASPHGGQVREPLADPSRNPTLSYTQRLEERIKELEDQLSKAQSQSQSPSQPQPNLSESLGSSSHDGSHLGRGESGEGLAGTFRGLKLDERGVLTYHGATSFFHLPSEYAGHESGAPSSLHPENPLSGRRERLVNNAWQQRALEDLSEIPVSNPGDDFIPLWPPAIPRGPTLVCPLIEER